MFARPKPSDSEDDILKMQKDFFGQKSNNPQFTPAAKMIKLEAPKKSKSRGRHISTPSVNDLKASSSDSKFVFGEIIERHFDSPKADSTHNIPNFAFPKAERMKAVSSNSKTGKSLFALAAEKKTKPKTCSNQRVPMECDSEVDLKALFGNDSTIIDDPVTAAAIHAENLEILSKMKSEEILSEREKILQSIDPSLISLLAKRRDEKNARKSSSLNETKPSRVSNKEFLTNSNVVVDILKHSSSEKWINFDVVEKDKLEWMRDIPDKVAKLKPGEKFEARFDWKGVLLPYSEENDKAISVIDNRELYMHGDEPHRPGYTLQELFRLARSNIVQQRVSAFSAIAGMISIYNQGFYDSVLDLPISKIFFLLRFGFDENTPAILEVVSRALSYMFYNETDEELLDFIYENTGCYWQPKLECDSLNTETDDPTSVENLQKQLKQLQMKAKISSNRVKANVDESEEESKTSMSDFQLAETDLMDCFLRTNILQRIYFILSSVRPDNSTVTSSLKLLIRIARSGKEEATKIVNFDELMQLFLVEFLPGLETVDTTLKSPPFYGYPQYLVLKLIRVMISQSLSIALKLISLNIIDKIENYLFHREDLKGNFIKLQIESLRLIRCLMIIRADNSLYRKLLPAFRYMLEWHFNHFQYEEGGPYLIRQHASALLGAISSGPNGFEVNAALGDTLNNCCCSWFYKATKNGIKEFSQSTLLTACLNVVTWFTRNSDYERFRTFNEKYLKDFLRSQSFIQFEQSLASSSILLKTAADRRNIHSPLPNTGSVLVNRFGPQLVISQTYCAFFLTALWQLVEKNVERNEKTLIEELFKIETIEPIVQYLKMLSTDLNHFLATNFFVKCELKLVFKLLSFECFKEFISNEQFYQVAYNFLCTLTPEHILEIEQMFDKIVFNTKYLNMEQDILKKWQTICLECLVYPYCIVVPATEISLSLKSTQMPILSSDWPYFQLKIILENYLENIHQKSEAIVSEREAIRMTLTFTTLLESNNCLHITSPTEKLMYLMICFMGQDSEFLEPEIKSLLQNYIRNFYQNCKQTGTIFQFDSVFEGKCKFENLYALFVDHFQAASYGDNLFSSLVLIPMAQKYDNKWRRRIWSDYGAVLRFLDCDESLLIGGLEAYLQPPETDESLIKAYVRALTSDMVRPNTIPHKIASHHYQCYKNFHPNKIQ